MTELSVIICFLLELIMASASMKFSAQCESFQDVEPIQVIQGEGLRQPCPNIACGRVMNSSQIFWFKNGSDEIQPITTEETKRVHYHGAILYFLPLSINDTGHYITQWWSDALCEQFDTYVTVSEKFHTDQIYGNISQQVSIESLDCPVWQNRGENITWYKDFRLIPHKSDVSLKVYLPSDASQRIYTCVCTWEHRGQVYNTSGSFQLQRKNDVNLCAEHTAPFRPTFQYPSNNSVVFVDLGAEVTLNCLVFFGIGTTDQRRVYWMKYNSKLNCYNQKENNGIKSSFTIRQISGADLQEHEYCCIASSPTEWDFVCITLRARQSVLPVIVTFSCLVLILVLTAGMVKWFTVDLVLFFRRFRIMQRKGYDGKIYDAYVIYPMDDLDEKAANKVAHFVNKVLPAVLENACGFKLFISGRDDLPGEDCIALTETRMKLSRRLIAVLPPDARQHEGLTRPLCYDWHVGLHRVLVEQDLRVIFIQLGDMKGCSPLPRGLLHLLQMTPPLQWDERRGRATCPTSCFWKQVRYMMPVPPACTACPVSNF